MMIGLRAQADFLLLRLTPNSLFQEALRIARQRCSQLFRWIEVLYAVEYPYSASTVLMNRSALPFVRGVYGLVRFGIRPSALQASRQGLER